MARAGSGAGTESVFRHPLNAMTRLSQRSPLRVKLITALLALVALALAVISFTSIAVFQGYLLNQADVQLQSLQAKANSALNVNGGGFSAQRGLEFEPNGYVVELLNTNGQPYDFGNLQQLTTAPPRISTSPSWLIAHSNEPVTVPAASGGGSWRVIVQSETILDPSTGQTTQAILVVGQSLDSLASSIRYLTELDVIVSLVIMLGLAVVSVAVVRTNLRPLDDIEETAEDIAAGRTSTAGYRTGFGAPRSGGWAGPSTACWPRSKRLSTPGRSRRRPRSSPRSGCAASSRTRATSCARR